MSDIPIKGDHPRHIIKSAFSFLSGTAFSRVTGLIRDMSMAFCFGTDPAIAAFLVAYRFASLLRRIFGEGALLTSFIPHFESFRGRQPEKAAEFFRDTFLSLMVTLILMISVIEAALYIWMKSGDFSADNAQIVLLTMLMLPSLLFLCLYSLCSGLLQCEKHFFLSGIAPVMLNLVWILSIWFLRDLQPQEAMIPLALSIVAACFFQWLVTIPKTISFLLKHLSWRNILLPKLFSCEIRLMLASISLGIIGVSAAQFNSAIDTLFARHASLQGPAYLNYAIHLQQLPLALFGIGISSALLPPLSRAIQAQDRSHYLDLLQYALSKTILLLIPCSMGIIVLGGVSINLIYGRGDFDLESTIQTTYCLWGYGIGLVPMAISLLLAPAFYATKDYRTPTLASLFSILLNMVLNTLFVVWWEWGTASLAVSTSLAALFNALFLASRLTQKTEFPVAFFLCKISWKLVLKVGFAGALSLYIGEKIFGDPSLGLLFGEDAASMSSSFSRFFTEQLGQFFSLFTLFFGLLGLFWITERFRTALQRLLNPQADAL